MSDSTEILYLRVDVNKARFPQYAAIEGDYDNLETGEEFPSFDKPAERNHPIVTLKFDGAWIFKFGKDSISLKSTAKDPTLISPEVLAKHGIISIRRPVVFSTTEESEEKMYTDPDFPPNEKSLGVPNKKGEVPLWAKDVISWRRPHQLVWGSKLKFDLFDSHGPQPYHVNQGGLGDCWFLAAARAIAQNSPDDIRKCFPEGKIRSNGSVLVTLYDPRVQKKVEMLLDTLLPSTKDVYLNGHTYWVTFARLASSSAEEETVPLWVPLLEKAFARLFRSYSNLEGGYHTTAYQILGFEDVGMIWDSRKFPKLPPKSWITVALNRKKQQEYLAKNPTSYNDIFSFYDEQKGLTPEKDLFSTLKALRENGVVGGGTVSAASEDDYVKVGIFPGHAYNVRNLQTVYTKDGNHFDLICLGNPWGEGGAGKKGQEPNPTGTTWRDKGDAWKQYPEVLNQLDHTQDEFDGKFYMNFSDANAYHVGNAPKLNDFLDYFGVITFAQKVGDGKPDDKKKKNDDKPDDKKKKKNNAKPDDKKKNDDKADDDSEDMVKLCCFSMPAKKKKQLQAWLTEADKSEILKNILEFM